MQDFQKLAEQYFAENKNAKEIHITNDGFMFEHKYFATQHNATLGEGAEVETFKNAKGIVVNDSEPVELNEEQKELLANGLVKANYIPMKELVKELGLEVENQKAETLIAALEDFRDNQKV